MSVLAVNYFINVKNDELDSLPFERSFIDVKFEDIKFHLVQFLSPSLLSPFKGEKRKRKKESRSDLFQTKSRIGVDAIN